MSENLISSCFSFHRSIIRDHLNILGIHDILFPIERLNISSTTAHLSVSPVNQTPGMTIFDQIWLNWDWLKLCSTSKTYISSPSFSSWSEFSDYVLSEFSRLLSPTVDGGQGIVYVLWLLLWCGHVSFQLNQFYFKLYNFNIIINFV